MITNSSGPDMHFLDNLQLVHNKQNIASLSPSYTSQARINHLDNTVERLIFSGTKKLWCIGKYHIHC